MATEGKERKADQVADHLMRRIVRGEVEVGEILPREAELAEAHGVNRSVVREAIKLLEVHQLVRPVRRRGTVVLDPLASLTPEVLRVMLSPSPGRVDPKVLEGLLEVRAILDIEMTAAAAVRREPQDVEALKACLETLASSIEDRPRYDDATEHFTALVARATQNPLYVMLTAWNRRVVADLDHVFRMVRPAREPHLQGLELLAQLIERGEAEATRSLVRAFHDWAIPRILAAVSLSTSTPLAQVMEEKR